MTRATASSVAPVAHRGGSGGLRRLGPALGTLLERLAADDIVAAGAPRRYRAMAGGPMTPAMTPAPIPKDDR